MVLESIYPAKLVKADVAGIFIIVMFVLNVPLQATLFCESCSASVTFKFGFNEIHF